MNKPALHTPALAAAILAAAAILTHAGPLDPPTGSITSTYKTLAEVEPRTIINSTNTPGDPAADPTPSLFKITQPGSYYLTGNITGAIGKRGIEIAASNVTIDLMGFTLTGSSGSLTGIATEGVRNNLTVRNGVVTSWGSGGIILTAGGSGDGALIEDVHAHSNAASSGIQCGNNSLIRSCTSVSNAGNNIVCGNSCAIDSCIAGASTGIHGITTGAACTIRSCTAFGNAVDGIATGNGCTVIGCAALDNTDDGIAVALGSTVTACSAYSNSGDGLIATASVTISNCTAHSNSGDGIQVGTDCLVLANQCDSNGLIDGAGINATSPDNRIEANNITDTPRGIVATSSGNIIIRNTVSGSTNKSFDVVAGNFGQYVAALSSPAVSGEFGGVSIGSTDPWVNFSY